MLLTRICLDNAANESDFVRRSCMFRFSSLFSVFCAGCFCTLTVQQVPAWSEAALPRTQAIAPDVSTAVRRFPQPLLFRSARQNLLPLSRRRRQHRLQQHRRSQPAAHLSKPQRKPQRQLLQHAPQLSPQKPRRYLQKHRRHRRKQIHFFRNTIPHSKPTWTTAPLRTPVPNSTPYSRMRGQTAAGCGEAVMTIWLPWGQAS